MLVQTPRYSPPDVCSVWEAKEEHEARERRLVRTTQTKQTVSIPTRVDQFQLKANRRVPLTRYFRNPSETYRTYRQPRQAQPKLKIDTGS